MLLEATILADKPLAIVTERGNENNNEEEMKAQEVDAVMEDMSSTLHVIALSKADSEILSGLHKYESKR